MLTGDKGGLGEEGAGGYTVAQRVSLAERRSLCLFALVGHKDVIMWCFWFTVLFVIHR